MEPTHRTSPQEPEQNAREAGKSDQTPFGEFSEADTLELADTLAGLKQSLSVLMGWGLIWNKRHEDELALAAEELRGLVECYGANYAPTPERIARFPDYAKAGRFTFGLRAVVNHWKRAVDWMNQPTGEANGSSTGTHQPRSPATIDGAAAIRNFGVNTRRLGRQGSET